MLKALREGRILRLEKVQDKQDLEVGTRRLGRLRSSKMCVGYQAFMEIRVHGKLCQSFQSRVSIVLDGPLAYLIAPIGLCTAKAPGDHAPKIDGHQSAKQIYI